MGMIQHKALLVTSNDRPKLMKSRRKAMKLFDNSNVTAITGAGMNGYETFVVVPCGSKLGWEESQKHHSAMETFIEFLDSMGYEDGSSPIDYVEVNYGEFPLTANHNGIEASVPKFENDGPF
jgi:hypothetical protein